MEVSMISVESSLARVSKNCNPRSLERITNNAAKMDAHTRSRGQSLSPH
jgi:hypothetical protein